MTARSSRSRPIRWRDWCSGGPTGPFPSSRSRAGALPCRGVRNPAKDITGFDLSRLPSLVESLANLRTQEFVQYRGIFPTNFGLDHPRLTIQVQLSGSLGAKELRIGNQLPEGPLYATTETGSAGEVLTLAGPAWVELARVSKSPLPELPQNVFTPEKPGSAQ